MTAIPRKAAALNHIGLGLLRSRIVYILTLAATGGWRCWGTDQLKWGGVHASFAGLRGSFHELHGIVIAMLVEFNSHLGTVAG